MTKPSNPPPAGPPGSVPDRPSSARRWLPFAAVGAIAAIGLGTWAVVAATSSRTGVALPPEQTAAAPNVSKVAGQVIAAAQAMDVDAGLALLCDTPSSDQIEGLREWIAQAKSEAGTDRPEFSLGVSQIQEDSQGGSFRIAAQGAGAIADRHGLIDVEVSKQGQWYCISDVDIVDYAVRTSETDEGE